MFNLNESVRNAVSECLSDGGIRSSRVVDSGEFAFIVSIEKIKTTKQSHQAEQKTTGVTLGEFLKSLETRTASIVRDVANAIGMTSGDDISPLFVIPDEGTGCVVNGIKVYGWKLQRNCGALSFRKIKDALERISQ